MRMLLSLHQNRIGDRIKLTMRRLLELATIDGARDLGIADKVGSLTPGKRADMLLVRITDPNIAPLGDPFEALVALGQPVNIDTVLVDGRILLRNGQYGTLDHDSVVQDATKSLAALRERAKSP
jgi:cytosine/adenosine deaminase-related metal-dependent hydrolase